MHVTKSVQFSHKTASSMWYISSF